MNYNIKILITGSQGYIGQHLVKKLKIVDTLDIVGNPTHKINIRNSFNIDEEYDAVIHLAAKVQVGESVKDPLLYYDTNINGTINVLNIKTKNFIFASTGLAEYMQSPYAVSKKAAEEIVVEYCTKNNINYTIFRFYNVIGCNTNLKPTNPDGLFYALIKAIDTKQFNIYGNDYNTPDGTCIRDYVHVNEICNAIIKAIDLPANKIESLGHGTGNSVLTIVNKFKEVNNVDFNVNFVDRREGDIEVSVLKETSSYLTSEYSLNRLLQIS